MRTSPGAHLILRSGMRGKPIEWRARLSVFLSSMAMVIGPTPPGTGVMAPATLLRARVGVESGLGC